MNSLGSEPNKQERFFSKKQGLKTIYFIHIIKVINFLSISLKEKPHKRVTHPAKMLLYFFQIPKNKEKIG